MSKPRFIKKDKLKMQVQQINNQTSFGARSVIVEDLSGLGSRVVNAVNEALPIIYKNIGDDNTDILIRTKFNPDILLPTTVTEDLEIVAGELEICIQQSVHTMKKTFFGKLKPQTKIVSNSIFSAPTKAFFGKSLTKKDILRLTLESLQNLNNQIEANPALKKLEEKTKPVSALIDSNLPSTTTK